MNKDELLALRERLLAEITPLVIENTGDGTDRFSLLMRVIQSGRATGDVYARAYESAKSIAETPERLEALMSLLDEVEVDLTQAEEAAVAAPVSSPPEQVAEVLEQPQQPQQPEQHEQHDQNNQ